MYVMFGQNVANFQPKLRVYGKRVKGATKSKGTNGTNVRRGEKLNELVKLLNEINHISRQSKHNFCLLLFILKCNWLHLFTANVACL